MNRYDISATEEYCEPTLRVEQVPDGEWVRYWDAHAAAQKLRAAFDALLIAEVQQHGGIAQYVGRCGTEQMAFREAVAQLLTEYPE